ncbi:Uncharacterized protein PBTT_03991 [Plasmodiophora brassicae]
MGRLLRSIVAIGVLVVVGDATNVRYRVRVYSGKRRGTTQQGLCVHRRDVDGPAETRVHVAEAIVHLEDARLLLREAERLIVSAGSIFFGDPLHIRLPSDAPDTTTSPARHDADPPGFESVFGNFERGLSMCLASYQQSVQVMETLIRRTANATGCVLRNFAWNRGAAALTRRLMSVLRIQRPVGHRPNIFAIRDRTFVHLPARRFWNVTRVSMGDLADAMTISLRQIAATRTMLVQMGADRVIIHELFSQAMILSRRRMLATTDILADARRRLPTLPTMINMAAVDADLAAARANLDLLKVLVVHLALLQERYEDALELVDNARRHVQQSCYLANLPSVFRHRTARAA